MDSRFVRRRNLSARLVLLGVGCAVGLWLPVGRAQDAGPAVVSLAPNLTELVCELGWGAALVGRTSACDYPASIATVPIVGAFGRPTLEAVLRAHPTLVLATEVEKETQMRVLTSAGIRVERYPCGTWDELMQAARGISRTLGDGSRGEAWAQQMQRRREDLEQTIATASPDLIPTVFVEVWGDPLTTAGRDSYLGECIRVAGGRSISADLAGSYPHVSMEWVVDQDPDVILVLAMGPGDGDVGRIAARPGWEKLEAVREQHILSTLDPDLLLRPGPRLIEGMARLADYLMNVSTNLPQATPVSANIDLLPETTTLP